MKFNITREWLERFRDLDDEGHCAAGTFALRLKPLRLDDLDVRVMQALVRLGEGAYDVPIHSELEKETGHDVSLGDIYNSLCSLEDQGLVTSTLGEPAPERGNLRPRYYRIHATGELALQAKLEEAERAHTHTTFGELAGGTV